MASKHIIQLCCIDSHEAKIQNPQQKIVVNEHLMVNRIKQTSDSLLRVSSSPCNEDSFLRRSIELLHQDQRFHSNRYLDGRYSTFVQRWNKMMQIVILKLKPCIVLPVYLSNVCPPSLPKTKITPLIRYLQKFLSIHSKLQISLRFNNASPSIPHSWICNNLQFTKPELSFVVNRIK